MVGCRTSGAGQGITIPGDNMQSVDYNHEEVQLKNEDEEVIDVRKRAQANRQKMTKARRLRQRQAKQPLISKEGGRLDRRQQ